MTFPSGDLFAHSHGDAATVDTSRWLRLELDFLRRMQQVDLETVTPEEFAADISAKLAATVRAITEDFYRAQMDFEDHEHGDSCFPCPEADDEVRFARKVYPRVMAQVRKEEATGCLRYTGQHNPAGYGTRVAQWHGKSRGRMVHRLVYLAKVGPIPDLWQIDHVWDRGCRYRDCVLLEHLEAVPQAENVRRSASDGGDRYEPPTHCPKGHLYERTERPRGRRVRCPACVLVAKRRNKERYRSRVLPRVACPDCGSDVALRQSGRMYEHQRPAGDPCTAVVMGA